MTDTTLEILKKQSELVLSKPIEVRYAMQADMVDYAVNQTKALVKKRYPHLSDREVMIEFFRLYYKDDFSEGETQKIVDHLRKH